MNTNPCATPLNDVFRFSSTDPTFRQLKNQRIISLHPLNSKDQIVAKKALEGFESAPRPPQLN